MKLIKKLAEDYMEKEMIDSMDRSAFLYGFRVGFNKAREMAQEKMNQFEVAVGLNTAVWSSNGLSDFRKEETRVPLGQVLKDLGEEHVPDLENK